MKDTVDVNGHHIGPSTDLHDLIRRQLKWGTALGQQPDEGPETAVFSLFSAASGTALEAPLVQAALDLLLDPDLAVRAGVVDVVQQFPRLFDSSHLLQVLDSNPQLFDAPGGGSRPDLAYGLLRAAAAYPSHDSKVTQRLRAAVTDPTRGAWVLAGLVEHDTDWVLAHLPEVIDGDKNRAKIVIFRLKDPHLRERMVRQIPRESPQLRSVVSEAVSEEVKDPEERRQLLSFLG